MHYLRKVQFLAAIVFWLIHIQLSVAQQDNRAIFDTPEAKSWADSIFNTLTYEQKIGQLFMVDAYSNRDTSHTNAIVSLICDYHIGGVIFFQGGPVRQAALTNYYQELAGVPLMIGIDGEWGLSMRLDSTIRFPRQMTLGAGNNDSLVYSMAEEIGRQCNRMGIHLNFAPVADINNNPLNPVINSRSFGESKEKVTSAAVMYTKGLQDRHVMACGKHFPGHGNTDSDSHFTLPVINQSTAELDALELYPFKELIRNRIASMMVAHLYIPAYDSTFNLAATLSPKVTHDLLQQQLGFRGLVFTDALNMKGVAAYYPGGELELMALKAGNDVLLYPANVPQAWMRIHYAIQNCEIEQEMVDQKVKKILMAKFWAGLNRPARIEIKGLVADLNTPEADALNRKLFENAITVVKNEDKMIPFRELDDYTIASVAVNDTFNNPFQQMILNYSKTDLFRMDKDISQHDLDSLVEMLSRYEYVILSIHNTSVKAASGYGVSEQTGQLFQRLQSKVKLVTVVFGNAYTLNRLPDVHNTKCLVLSYEDTYWPQYYTAQALFGASRAPGKIPVTPGNSIDYGMGQGLPADYTRLRFSSSLEKGIDPDLFARIDTIATHAIRDTATPGCQVFVAWKGNVIYQKSFGSFTYEDTTRKVRNTDLYDIASVTKIAATALAIMKLHEEKEIDIRKKASKYFPELRKTNKKDLLISDILTHQAGLKAWMPFFKNTLEDGKPAYNFYHPVKDVNYSIAVTDSLYIINTYPQKMWEEIISSPVAKPGTYVYSDIGMIILQKLVEEVTGRKLDEYVYENFYEPLGLHRLMFNPSGKVHPGVIAPTELDTAFRKSLIHGYVHDPAAAMMGGVAGHAGLFSDAGSLAVIMQMLLNEGQYGGKRFFKKETVKLFTRRYHLSGNNRRGLAFDKPEPDKTKNGPTAMDASVAAFGHSGFTGATAWADPWHDLVYVFLSNRVYPSASNNKLAKNNYRTDIMQVIYDIIQKQSLSGK